MAVSVEGSPSQRDGWLISQVGKNGKAGRQGAPNARQIAYGCSS
jgi:hypothetical protein